MKASWRTSLILGIGCCLTVLGCNGPIYAPDRVIFSDAITPRSRWLATGDLRDPFYVIDNNINTAAVIEGNYENATLTIDMGKACLFNMVVVDHGQDEWNFCRKLAVLISDDGKSFRQAAVVPGLRRVTTVLLVRRVLARYIRLEAVAAGGRAWSIAEVYVN